MLYTGLLILAFYIDVSHGCYTKCSTHFLYWLRLVVDLVYILDNDNNGNMRRDLYCQDLTLHIKLLPPGLLVSSYTRHPRVTLCKVPIAEKREERSELYYI